MAGRPEIEDTCPCGARFVSRSRSIDAAQQHREWLRAHQECRHKRRPQGTGWLSAIERIATNIHSRGCSNQCKTDAEDILALVRDGRSQLGMED